jgi:hypothetical protein
MVKLIERDRYEQQEHLHSLFIMLDIFLLVFQPPSDLSAMRISLLRFFSFVIEPSKIETALDFLSDTINFMANKYLPKYLYLI